MDAGLGQRRPQLPVPEVVLAGNKLVQQAGQLRALLSRRQPVRTGVIVAVFNPLQQAGNAHLEKLVEIARRNRQELYPLQQGIGIVLRFLQHPAVELQPREITVEVILRIIEALA